MMRRASIILPLLVASAATAQPTNTKTLADQLFRQGRDFAKAGNWAEACPKFEASLQYDPAIGTKLNLAACYEWIGKPASAWGLYREVIEEATRTRDKRLAVAKKSAAKLEPTLPKLMILPPSPEPPGLVVERDGVVIAPAELGTGIYVDPGPHHIKASAPGFVAHEHDVEAVESKGVSYAIPPLEPAPVVPETVMTAGQPIDAPAPRSNRRLIGVSVGVGGLAIASVGLVFGARASGKLNDAKELCGGDLVCPRDDVAAGQALVDDSRAAATISTVLVVAGGVAVVAGIVLVVTAPSRSERSLAVVPVITDEHAGLSAVGRF